MFTLLPIRHLFRRAARFQRRDIKEFASRSWQLAPAETRLLPPATFLPGQLERVTGYEFVPDDFRCQMYGGIEIQHAATVAYLVEDAHFIDGVLYKGVAQTVCGSPRHRIPRLHVAQEIARGAVYCTPGGERYFGQWLLDDCVTYPLACNEGTPLTTATTLSDHATVYERCLGMNPCRVEAAFVRKLVVFDDFGQNANKRARFRSLSARLEALTPGVPHPGVFVIRGTRGSRRVLKNEDAVARHLQETRGFRIVDPMQLDVPAILSACAGARVIVGIEGSHLVHALLLMQQTQSLLIIQPPFRFSTGLKDVANREEVQFGFVVGHQDGIDFTVDIDEVERTLDLLAAQGARRD